MSRAVTGARQPRHSHKASAPALPFGMEGRAGSVVDGDDAHTALMRELNYFPTPPWAARAGGELVRMLDPAARSAWEPACGGGHMALPLMTYFPEGVWRTDVHAHEGPGGAIRLGDFPRGDFDRERNPTVDWVITNPPFAKAEAFVQKGLGVARRGVAMLCRLAFTESVGRYPLMQRKALTAPFAERVPMQLGSWDPDLSSATAYAWFIWMQPEALADSPFRDAIEGAWAMNATLERIIAPGTCERLTQADDRVVYAGEVPDPQMGLL
ncbi:hypothetical protein [uncultured Brevundimonas sp.]|uniref:hypothetical protein n=1 Tax=uncultured Brevundimonas sp. TaxID=213418 RepID=UPI0025FC2719|nr:hypothetical protein [uncultured Brevundimonas sp.]